MMLYHMNQDDRDQFTTENKPTNLPTELAEGLSGDLKTFLRDKYAPAWLCQSFAASDKYAGQFTAQQQKKLWYWWHGNGKGCLARSKEYNSINKLTLLKGVFTMGMVSNQFGFMRFFQCLLTPVCCVQNVQHRLQSHRPDQGLG